MTKFFSKPLRATPSGALAMTALLAAAAAALYAALVSPAAAAGDYDGKVAARCRWTSPDAQLPAGPIPAYAGSRNPGLIPSGSGMRNVLRIIETSA
jgi:hypothetical protein